MKKLLSCILCLCLLWYAAVSAETVNDGSFLLKIRDESGLDITYLRFDFYAGGEYRGYVCSTTDEGEDFYRCPYSTDHPEELKDLRIEVSYGKSDLDPEEAILKVMKGEPGEEHPLQTLDLIPECGKIYELRLIPDGQDGWQLTAANEN